MPAPLFRIPRTGAGQLLTMPAPAAAALDATVAEWVAEGVTGVVCLLPAAELAALGLNREAAAVQAAGLGWHHLPIGDFGVPLAEEARGVVADVVAQLAAGQTVAVHCRMGIGRASTVAGLVLVEEGLSADEAFARISAARGMFVPETPHQRAFVVEWEENR